EVLLIGWGSTWGPIREAVDVARESGRGFSAIHLRHLHPMPNGIDKLFEGFSKVVVVEMNDQGMYGYGQLATLLRARYANPNILSLTKTDGLTYRVREILAGIERVVSEA
ncbi:MAG: 2-oxoglutarate ferredoxin oxidoreductase subunit alpha, partial [Pseudoalteromonas tetraodonis]